MRHAAWDRDAVGDSDPRSPGPGPRNTVERWFVARLKDPRDLRFVRVSIRLTLKVTFATGLLLSFDLPTWVALAWPLILFASGDAGRYSLMLHAVSHRPLFRRSARTWEAYIPWVLGPFFGHTPGSFYVHHMGMHHPENNMLADQSSTLMYQRDSWLHFLHYWGRFFVVGAPHLLRYLRLRNRHKLARRFVRGEIAWAVGVLALLLWKPVAALALFGVPFCLMRFFMMTGNWSQHAFVDVDDPDNCYRNSTVLADAPYNHNCYNDGYHIVHHIRPAMHWTEMPDWFVAHREEFGRQDAVVFQGVTNNQVIFWWLMTQQWGRLADHVVDLPGAPSRTRAQKVAWLQDRTRRRVRHPRGFLALEPAPAA